MPGNKVYTLNLQSCISVDYKLQSRLIGEKARRKVAAGGRSVSAESSWRLYAMAALSLLLAVALAGASDAIDNIFNIHKSSSHGKVELPPGCLYDGRWYDDGASVRTREACLVCACASGALSCRRRTCAPLPEPPPRCHTLHRRGDCCPHIHCPDGVIFKGPEAILEDKLISRPDSVGLALPACVEGGTVYAAGSAMSSNTACEQCFCLGGTRRCVRPQCLPPPSRCHPRPAPGACCPQRFYCDHPPTIPPTEKNEHDCKTPDGLWIEEGKSVKSMEDPCTQCFCLRGTIQCQHMSCSPNLLGCKPLVQPGQCCPHQYQCAHTKQATVYNLYDHVGNFLEPVRNEDRSFHPSKSTKRETTIKSLSTVMDRTSKPSNNIIPATASSDKSTTLQENESTVITESTQTVDDILKDSTTVTEASTTEELPDSSTTEQPENSVKIMVNGTINCTAELSSTSLYNITSINDTLKMHAEIQPRIPFIDSIEVESHTFPANELITERNHDELDETESFVINVTSSLRTNTTFPSILSTSTTVLPKTALPILADTHNITKKTKDDADYDYNEPTLPPSLPNLKIIPFVAADAVVEEDLSPKENLYSTIEREDKFPVYYPSMTRREDIYKPNQYPVFTNKENVKYSLPHQLSELYTTKVKDVEKPIEITVGTSFKNTKENKPEHNSPLIENMAVETPAINLFSPPVETEGGFVPKSPNMIDDFYAVFSSTTQGPIIPHLTTSMQIDNKDDCVTSDGRKITEGDNVKQACSICTCAWGELHCSPQPCDIPRGCFRRPTVGDPCCGNLVCEQGNHSVVTDQIEGNNGTDIILEDESNNSNVNQATNSFVDPVQISITTSTSVDLSSVTTDESKLREHNETSIQPINGIKTTTVQTTKTDKPQEVHNGNVSDTNTQSQEYEDEEDDEGFSLGSVLQLLLSETYEPTTAIPFKKMPPRTASSPKPPTTTTSPVTTSTAKPAPSHFIPTKQYSFVPPKKLNSVNRIDHLVLGEATAIKRTSTRSTTTKPIVTTRKLYVKPTPRPLSTKTVEITSKGQVGQAVDVSKPPNVIPGLLPGLPKLAGCNIYGRMYRVGRIISELSTPCQECKCTELGVQCRQLTC
ncbi:unnamed protein product [Leptosia nina]|uniref:VWFC domain-containing protein n=1 Tax=Leptosia nina TaxID=320188 RepID=A0AAV1JT57_9NEOP